MFFPVPSVVTPYLLFMFDNLYFDESEFGKWFRLKFRCLCNSIFMDNSNVSDDGQVRMLFKVSLKKGIPNQSVFLLNAPL